LFLPLYFSFCLIGNFQYAINIIAHLRVFSLYFADLITTVNNKVVHNMLAWFYRSLFWTKKVQMFNVFVFLLTLWRIYTIGLTYLFYTENIHCRCINACVCLRVNEASYAYCVNFFILHYFYVVMNVFILSIYSFILFFFFH
jgi:hypothetical protein